jgi:dihydrofolate reductase
MGKLKLQMQVTVDGCPAEGTGADVDWDQIEPYSRELLDSADTIVIGRKTAVEFIPYWDDAANRPGESWYEVAKRISSARKVVFSRTLEQVEWNNTTLEKGDLAVAMTLLKEASEKDIIVYGGVSFVSTLIGAGLIDEFHLFVNPVALGRGDRIFGGLAAPQKLRLVRSIAYSGLVLLNYERA